MDSIVNANVNANQNIAISLFDQAKLRLDRDALVKVKPSPFHQEISHRLLERLDEIKRDFKHILIIGARSDDLIAAIMQKYPNAYLTIIEISPKLLENLPAHHNATRICHDFESLPNMDAGAGFDLVISNLILHWVDQLPHLLQQIQRRLIPDGLFLASMIGGRSLASLREALIKAEIELCQGAHLRVSPMVDVPDAGRLLHYAGFALPMADKDILNMQYQDFFAALKGLSEMGEANKLNSRPRKFTSKLIFAKAESFYNQGASLKFEVIYLLGWKASPNQSKPKARGSGTLSLKDFL